MNLDMLPTTLNNFEVLMARYKPCENHNDENIVAEYFSTMFSVELEDAKRVLEFQLGQNWANRPEFRHVIGEYPIIKAGVIGCVNVAALQTLQKTCLI